jgi:hypothetical protein
MQAAIAVGDADSRESRRDRMFGLIGRLLLFGEREVLK